MQLPLSDVLPSPTSLSIGDFQHIIAGDSEACRVLLDQWEPMIKRIVRRYVHNSSDSDDLLQVGRLALWRAANYFKAAAGFQFGHYAKRAIKNNVRREAARLARERSRQWPLDGNPEVLERLNADEAYRAQVVAEVITERMSALPSDQQAIFRLLYVEGLTQRAAARQLGVSQPRVAQLHRSLLQLGRAVFTP